tara:strand:+ start:145 stop:1344 length:1200 start_codon:yes stop_codon:yes gene_type:complete
MSKILSILHCLLTIFVYDFSKAQPNNLNSSRIDQIEMKYLESRKELENYILDTGDELFIEFLPADELNGIFRINEEGELFLPKLRKTYIRGLTTTELKTLLQKKYSEFLVDPEIKLRIVVFKPIRVLIQGEVRNPGIYEFSPYRSGSFLNFNENKNNDDSYILGERNDSQFKIDENPNSNAQNLGNTVIKRSNENITTISDAIRRSGGITSMTDLSRIEIVRDVPIGKGGGKKKTIIDFNSYINEFDPTYDIRLFDGDSIFLPKLNTSSPTQIPKSILSGISPRFIQVNLYGRIENTGTIKLPLESTLSDAIDLSGPIKPLSGKIILIRYEKDGTVLKKNIKYSARAKKGSENNPFLKENDLISVKNSILGTGTTVIREITAPFVGIYTTKSLIDDISN